LERILDAIDAGSESRIYVNALVTTPEVSAAIRYGLRHRWTDRELLRIVREQRSNAKWVSRPIDQKVFFARPSTTGDKRWDALIAGSVEDLAVRGHAHRRNGSTMSALTESGSLPMSPVSETTSLLIRPSPSALVA
jgi:hypothetical protein